MSAEIPQICLHEFIFVFLAFCLLCFVLGLYNQSMLRIERLELFRSVRPLGLNKKDFVLQTRLAN